MSAKISLDQWQALIAVVDENGYAAAAEALGKSQSAISYAVQKIETELGVRAFALQGRRARLTDTGHLLYRQATSLVEEAARLESTAIRFGQGWEPVVRIAADILLPVDPVLGGLADLAEESPLTRVEFQQTTLSGAEEALLHRQVDLAITGQVPTGFIGDLLVRIRLVAVAATGHPLHQAGELDLEKLRRYRQLVLRDTGSQNLDAGWLGAEQRWTFSTSEARRTALARGLGFAWIPENQIHTERTDGRLAPLPLREGIDRFVDLYLVYTDGDYAGRAARYLGNRIRAGVMQADSRHQA